MVWDNFDIGKITNVGFKFDYVAPMKKGEVVVCQIELDDISTVLSIYIQR